MPEHADSGIDEADRQDTAWDTAALDIDDAGSDVWMVSCRSKQSLDVFSRRTLIFQPHVENVCHLGPACPRVNDEVHSTLYAHDKPLYNRKQRTELMNSNSRRRPRLPNVERAYLLRKDGPDFGALPGVPSRRHCIVFVHGFNESYYRVISHLAHLRKRIAKDGAPTSLVGFTWPSHTGSLMSGSYYGARAAAAKAGHFLRLTLAMLASRGNRLVLVGHSLGSRVALAALLDWPGATYPVAELHLAAPGVASDALSIRGEFPAVRLATPSITVFHSKRDAFLQSGFWAAEAGPAVVRGATAYRGALGAFGMSGDLGAAGRAKCTQVDCTGDVGAAHSIHAYINLFTFSTRILSSASAGGAGAGAGAGADPMPVEARPNSPQADPPLPCANSGTDGCDGVGGRAGDRGCVHAAGQADAAAIRMPNSKL